MPCTDEIANEYFGELFDIWFPLDNQPSGFDYESAKSTFMDGGYYRHDFPNETTSLLALNSMYFMSQNMC